MKTYTIEDIRALKPCYDPNKYLPEDWEGDAKTILDHPEIPPGDKIWVVRNWIDDKTLRLFAVWCAREAFKLLPNPDSRSVEACDVAERFANGEATTEELVATQSAARSAAWSAAESAAWYAAWSAAESAAWYATQSAARSAAWYAAWSAVQSAARFATWSAVQSAARFAAEAAVAAEAAEAAWSAQIQELRRMIS